MHALCSDTPVNMAYSAIATSNITFQVLIMILQDALFASRCRITRLCWLMLLV